MTPFLALFLLRTDRLGSVNADDGRLVRAVLHVVGAGVEEDVKLVAVARLIMEVEVVSVVAKDSQLPGVGGVPRCLGEFVPADGRLVLNIGGSVAFTGGRLVD